MFFSNNFMIYIKFAHWHTGTKVIPAPYYINYLDNRCVEGAGEGQHTFKKVAFFDMPLAPCLTPVMLIFNKNLHGELQENIQNFYYFFYVMLLKI